jgi:hypothetical protein
MASVTGLSSGLAYLTQAGGLLSNLPSGISSSELQSASPEDIVSLSLAAIQAQQADGLFGATTGSNILPGVSSADLSNATPQENAAIDNQALLLQQAQYLFGQATPPSSTFNLYA